jgi:hypothetical protein
MRLDCGINGVRALLLRNNIWPFASIPKSVPQEDVEVDKSVLLTQPTREREHEVSQRYPLIHLDQSAMEQVNRTNHNS